ncbi:MAG: glycerol-3-phosphate dehydrogenase C-terminal domain-containing protein, partial [Candidatus Eisenbacteria bacterium]|nr:glycerol-3-phosphate dehydrogenase C-terminal domain-containing protein [Candidatus Eisenbacteria bacterium]
RNSSAASDVYKRQVSNLVFERLHRRSPPCWGRVEALPGGEKGTMRAEESAAGSPAVARLIRLHGSRYRSLPSRGEEPESSWISPMPGIGASRAEILHPIREEAAMRLSDLVLRRTEIAADGPPGEACVAAIAAAIAPEMGWPASRWEAEVADTLAELRPWEEKAWASAP